LKVLADTSIWIDHLRGQQAGLEKLLAEDRIVMHTLVRAELSCGNLPRRAWLLHRWRMLNPVEECGHHEVLDFIEQEKLYGRGVGFVDCHLLTACVRGGARLWTRDRRLRALSEEIGVAVALP
jgi:predicted nucleic acid-binding protein